MCARQESGTPIDLGDDRRRLRRVRCRSDGGCGRTASPSGPTLRWAIAFAGALALAACSSSGDDASDRDATSSTTEATSSTTTSTTSPTTTMPPPAAEGGSDVAACFDGSCDLVVTVFPTEVPLDSSLGISAITFESARPDGVAWRPSDAGAILVLPVGSEQVIGNLALNIVSIEGATAVVRLSPA
jgi:hypothetical protein